MFSGNVEVHSFWRTQLRSQDVPAKHHGKYLVSWRLVGTAVVKGEEGERERERERKKG